jgi:hypothetical protein
MTHRYEEGDIRSHFLRTGIRISTVTRILLPTQGMLHQGTRNIHGPPRPTNSGERRRISRLVWQRGNSRPNQGFR